MFCILIRAGVYPGGALLANVAIPLGNLGPYFTLNVSKTFFSMSTKPLLSLTLDFLKNHSEELVETL